MLGAMQDVELRIPLLLDHAKREHGGREIVTRWADGRTTRTDWSGVHRDARRLAQALERLGVKKGERVATLAMNHVGHLIAWYGVIGMGGVIHTINPRLFEDQLAFIANHAEDQVLLYDAMFAPIVERMKPQWTTIRHYVCFDNGEFDALLDAEDGDYRWVTGPEREPCLLCYTSGTTGDPKGVLYTHRSNMIHALAELQPAVFDLDSRAVALPIVPMFHAVGWGMPFASAAAGIKLVFSTVNDPKVLCGLMNDEKVTHTAGVPTVWLAMFQHMDATGEAPKHLKVVTIGGSAAPRAMIERIMKMDVRVMHAWGMTETSPIGTMGAPSPDWDELTFEQKVDQTVRQGRVPFGVELRIVDDEDVVLPRDGEATGRLQIRGPWIVQRYFKADTDCVDAEGWFDTGDVAALHPDGTMRITDRSKDVIKSGGEWISSVELENAAVGCPGVAEAAAIGVRHPKWDERPILLVVRKPDSTVTPEEITAHLGKYVAKWWLPDEILFVDELPHTATGKLLKTAIRAKYRDYQLAAA
ncbi:MAG: long-chain fatty acid--CoA ligase [Sphingomonadales bacterium]|nr:long-chain fatty acid--CoA ligase [Sphingomonadales bacterium]